MLEYFSSPIRWCETLQGNIFTYSPFIVEFWNSITSLVFCFFAIYGYVKYQSDNKDNIPWLLCFSIGITSFLFHSTMSFTGQFLDELSIILLLTYCLQIYYKLNKVLYLVITGILSYVSWYYPSMSPLFLLISGLTLILTTYFTDKSDQLNSLWKYSFYNGIFSIFLWLFDFLCYFNTHMFWHVFIAISTYQLILFVLKSTNKIKQL